MSTTAPPAPETSPTADGALAAPPTPTLREAFAYWLRLGFLSFGGPAGQIALMHEDLVVRKRWISERRYLHALNYCMVLPGPEAQQLATYIGWLMHRSWGGILAGSLFVLPSLLILIALSWVCMAWGQVPAVAGVLYGIKPAVTAIVVSAAVRIGSRALKNRWLWAIAAAAFVAAVGPGLPFPLIVLVAGLIGGLGGRFAPAHFKAGGGHGGAGAGHGPAVIDDDTPTPAHARFTWAGFTRVLLASLALWALAYGALLAWQGPAGAAGAPEAAGTLAHMARFFTQAALLTFGGAYAVLPYVYQGAVEHFHWLSAAQMMDGLALGETTPGPLIMVVAYVGFVGAWTKAVFGPDALALAGIAGACVVTFFTFLPSFCFILLGGPFIESTHGNLKFTAPLTGITAAVVGVILSLAVFFAGHVLWPHGPGSTPAQWLTGLDAPAAAIGAAAALALFRFKRSVIEVVLGAAAAGWAWQLIAAH